jgi:hypothetical protein
MLKYAYVQWHHERVMLHFGGVERTWRSWGPVHALGSAAIVPALAALICSSLAIMKGNIRGGLLALALALFACTMAYVVL